MYDNIDRAAVDHHEPSCPQEVACLPLSVFHVTFSIPLAQKNPPFIFIIAH